MGGQLDGNFLPGSLPHKFILFVTLILCFVVNKFLYLSLSLIPFSQILPTTDSPVSSALNPRTTPTRAVTSEHFCFFCFVWSIFITFLFLYTSVQTNEDMPHRRRLRSASTEQLDVPTCRRSTVGGRAFPVAQQRCGMACQAMLRRPRRCRCSRTGCTHTCSAAATKRFDFELHLLFLVIISPPEQWSLQ